MEYCRWRYIIVLPHVWVIEAQYLLILVARIYVLPRLLHVLERDVSHYLLQHLFWSVAVNKGHEQWMLMELFL